MERAIESFARVSLLATWEEKEEEQRRRRRPHEEFDDELEFDVKRPFESALYCHVGILPRPTLESRRKVRVLVWGHGRENALAKDSKRVIHRTKLIAATAGPSAAVGEARRGGDRPFEEIVLPNEHGELLDGTRTNFFVVSNDGRARSPPPKRECCTDRYEIPSRGDAPTSGSHWNSGLPR